MHGGVGGGGRKANPYPDCHATVERRHYGSLTPARHQCLNHLLHRCDPSMRDGHGRTIMPTNIRQRAAGPGARLVGLLATIRWEAQFKLAKCCMRASKSISDLGVFLAEPVLERSKALNDVAARLRENAPG